MSELFSTFKQFPEHRVIGFWTNCEGHQIYVVVKSGEPADVVAINIHNKRATKIPTDIELVNFIALCEPPDPLDVSANDESDA